MLQDLRAPPRLRASVVPFTFGESEIDQKADQISKERPRAAEGMVIMISPAKTEQVLASFLDLSCPISFFPIAAFFREEKFTGNTLPDQLDSFGLRFNTDFNSIGITQKIML